MNTIPRDASQRLADLWDKGELLGAALFPRRGMSAAFAIVLIRREDRYLPYVTWALNLEDGELYGGDYLADQAEGWRSFHERQAPEIACYQ